MPPRRRGSPQKEQVIKTERTQQSNEYTGKCQMGGCASRSRFQDCHVKKDPIEDRGSVNHRHPSFSNTQEPKSGLHRFLPGFPWRNGGLNRVSMGFTGVFLVPMELIWISFISNYAQTRIFSQQVPLISYQLVTEFHRVSLGTTST